MIKRIVDEPAYVLHRYDWSESSLILEVLTRHYGRIALVAKGAKKPSSNFRPILLPLQPLHIAYGGEAEIRTLRSSEWMGGHVMPTGEALMAGYYLNELLMRLLARDDPHPVLFDAYALTVHIIAQEGQRDRRGSGGPGTLPPLQTLEVALRAFELMLLREIGLLPSLDTQTASLAVLEPDLMYVLVPEGGLRQAHADDRTSLSGSQWSALQAALDADAPFSALLQACSNSLQPLKSQLRTLLHYHCGVSTLKTRQMMMDLQDL
ncbi:MAG: DNA repair protein RecO [Burkholderiaceae bacterium]|nr:DNA repair protein RecO [Burkholderiaceae bacterium]